MTRIWITCTNVHYLKKNHFLNTHDIHNVTLYASRSLNMQSTCIHTCETISVRNADSIYAIYAIYCGMYTSYGFHNDTSTFTTSMFQLIFECFKISMFPPPSSSMFECFKKCVPHLPPHGFLVKIFLLIFVPHLLQQIYS